MVQTLSGVSLQSILSEVKQLQYLVYPMGFNLTIPTNLLQINSIALSIASIDLLDAEDIYAGLEFSETEPASKGLEQLGYESKNFLLNGGTLFITI